MSSLLPLERGVVNLSLHLSLSRAGSPNSNSGRITRISTLFIQLEFLPSVECAKDVGTWEEQCGAESLSSLDYLRSYPSG